jgi:hypothetical protein
VTAVTLTAAQLCQVFQGQASAVHHLVGYSFSRLLGVSEETITDMILVGLDKQLPAGHVVTRKFTPHEESSTSGADWLWAIGRPGRWIVLLVQAKLARPGEATLKKLHYKKGDQRRKLVAYARAEGCVPLYVVYSAFDGTLPPASKRKNFKPESWAPTCPLAKQIDQMGCVAVRPRHVALMDRGKAPKGSIMRLMNSGNPWACLFCCAHGSGQGELADSVLGGLRLLPIDEPEPSSPGGAQSNFPDDIFDLPDSLLRENPPELVQAILRGRDPEGEVPFSTVTIMSSVPLEIPTRTP